MSRIALIALALGGALAASGANAQSFTATVGYQNTDPKSDNGTLAGAGASINDDFAVTGSFSYFFNDNLALELWSGLESFDHNVTLDGLGTIASVEHRPTTLSLNYHFNTEGAIRPFVGVGYGTVDVFGERTRGALAGLGIDGDTSNGLSLSVGADWYVTDSFFVRADVRQLDFDTDVTVETLGNVGTAEVDPLIYGISAGLRF
jgi:outer membrane protein